MSKKPKIALPDIETEDGSARFMTSNGVKGLPYFKGAWKYENEPRVFFTVRVLRCPQYPYGKVTLVGIPESLVGKPKLEKTWIMYELGGPMVKLGNWRPFVLPEDKHKRLID